MHNLIIPMAGFGNRFVDQGYKLPKQLLNLSEITCLEKSLKSLDYKDANVILIARKEYLDEFSIDDILSNVLKEAKSLTVKPLDFKTRGSLETCMAAAEYLDPLCPTSIFTLDVSFTPIISLREIDFDNSDAVAFTIKTNNHGFSYLKMNDDGFAVLAAEKNRISEFGISGLYSFRDTAKFIEMSRSNIERGLLNGSEFYIAPLFNDYIKEGLKVKKIDLDSLIMFGTPREYEYAKQYCKSRTLPAEVKIGLASDHSGYRAKELFKKLAKQRGFKVVDYGCHSELACDYPDFVSGNAEAICSREVDIGFSFCSSGQGVNIAASKYRKIISVVAYSVEAFSISLAHNNPNHIAVPSSLSDEKYLSDLLDSLVSSIFEGGRHQDRLMKVLESQRYDL